MHLWSTFINSISYAAYVDSHASILKFICIYFKAHWYIRSWEYFIWLLHSWGLHQPRLRWTRHVRTFFLSFSRLWLLVWPFSDLPLEEKCSSKCHEEYMECSSTCEGPECLSDCNRESIACTDCKLQFSFFMISNAI